MGRRLVVLCIVIQFAVGAAIIGFFGDKDENKDFLLRTDYGRDLRLLCGSDDKERGVFRGERVLCHPRVGSEGSEI